MCIRDSGKEIFDNPQQVYTSYRFEPQENEELRFDVMAGSSCFQPLVANYYNGSTELFDRLNGFGAQAVFIAFPYENKEKGDGKCSASGGACALWYDDTIKEVVQCLIM